MMRSVFFKAKPFYRVLVSFAFLFVFYSSVHVTYAGPGEWLFKKIASVLPEVDIRRTVNNMIAETLTGVPLTYTVQRNADEMFNCGVAKNVEYWGRAEVIAGMPSVSSEEAEAIINEAVSYAVANPEVCDLNNVSYGARGNGSLLAMGITLDNAVQSEVFPVNLAAYFKDIARRTPILKDTAYAATYPIMGEDVVLDVWKLARNISYGVVSLAMIIVGIMIMMRKKINPQTAITIQNALPRLVISIVLITFSYPIGATLASLTLPAMRISRNFFEYTTEYTNVNVIASNFAMMALVWAGGAGLIFAIIILIVTLVCWIIALLKVLISYLRIMFAIITAPLSFAVGAVPGKEKVIVDWFKNVGVELATIAGTFFMIRLAFFIGFRALGSSVVISSDHPFVTGITEDGSIFSRALVAAGTPLIMIVCLATAMKMRGTMKSWILGDAAKKKR